MLHDLMVLDVAAGAELLGRIEELAHIATAQLNLISLKL